MKKLKKLMGFMYFFTFGMVFGTQYVYAYFDPSATTYLIQIVAAVFIAAGALIGVYWQKIKKFFRKKKNKKIRDAQLSASESTDSEESK